MRKGNVTSMGGVYIEMAHLGVENVSNRFPGMVKRCADCGFDLAGGRVEVVPTAHYMMGGIECDIKTASTSPGLYIAGEDCGGVHGANRLGGNGVANSTVYGAIAGDSMAAYVNANEHWKDENQLSIEQGVARAETPFGKKPDHISNLRDELYQTMWDKVGILRNQTDLISARDELNAQSNALLDTGLPDGERQFNLTWHDWLNMQSLFDISKVITDAALAREDSRGAHYREDYPETGDLDSTSYIRTSGHPDTLTTESVPVEFSIVKPGQSLIEDEAGAPPARN